MVLTKQTYNTQDKHKKPKDIHKKPRKLNLTKPNEPWFSRFLRYPARKQIGPILTKKPQLPVPARGKGWPCWGNVGGRVHSEKVTHPSTNPA